MFVLFGLFGVFWEYFSGCVEVKLVLFRNSFLVCVYLLVWIWGFGVSAQTWSSFKFHAHYIPCFAFQAFLRGHLGNMFLLVCLDFSSKSKYSQMYVKKRVHGVHFSVQI